MKICTSPPQPILLRLVNSAGTDLLAPGRPASYKFSDMSLKHVENGTSLHNTFSINSVGAIDTFFLTSDINWMADKGRNFYLTLSPTDIDTIYLRMDQVSEEGCSFFRFIEFKYNNVTVTPKTVIPNYPQMFEVIK